MTKKSNSKSSARTKPVPKSIRKDLTGERYGRLTVLGFAGYRDTAIMWRCQCDCGRVCDVYRANLRSGNSTQCKKCNHEDQSVRSTTHAMWGTPEYRAWERVRKHDKVCRRWEKFENFYEDMGDRPTKNHRLARKVAASGWKPSNVSWVHKSKQQTQRTSSRMITFRGKKQNLASWAKEVGISQAALRSRLESGWTVRKALTTKPRR